MGEKQNKKILSTSSEINKNFKYALGDISFTFTIRIDIKQQLKDALEMARKFEADLIKEIADMDARAKSKLS